jgi:acyl-CoA reductase-like NAD-dependent aldehyde dehydrogenase
VSRRCLLARRVLTDDRELFGPVLPLVPVEDVDEAIKFINAR